jgi:hypothetical protein
LKHGFALGSTQRLELPARLLPHQVRLLISLQYTDRRSGLKPLTRFYFDAQASNPNEQFYYFALLSVWLLKRNGQKFSAAVNQFDDPNATTTLLSKFHLDSP